MNSATVTGGGFGGFGAPADDPWGSPAAVAPHPVPANRLATALLYRDDLDRMPTPDPLILDTLDRGALGLLAGPTGSMKTFVALDMSASISTGRPWQGRAVEQGRVLWIAAEAAAGIRSRLEAWEEHHGTAVPPGEFLVLPVPVNLTDDDDVWDLAEVVANERVALVVVDTLARCAVGADENSARDMGVVIDALHQLTAAAPGVSVLVIHHTGKDGRTVRGSSALEAGMDTVYRSATTGTRVTLSRSKRREGPVSDEIAMTLEPVNGTESAALVSGHAAPLAPRARDLMSVIVSAFGGHDVPRADLRRESGQPSATFDRSLNALLKAGRIVNVGDDDRPVYRTVGH